MDTNTNKFAALPAKIAARHISMPGFNFDSKWAATIADFFQRERAASSLTYEVLYQFEGLEGVYIGLLTIDRDANMICQLKH